MSKKHGPFRTAQETWASKDGRTRAWFAQDGSLQLMDDARGFQYLTPVLESRPDLVRQKEEQKA